MKIYQQNPKTKEVTIVNLRELLTDALGNATNDVIKAIEFIDLEENRFRDPKFSSFEVTLKALISVLQTNNFKNLSQENNQKMLNLLLSIKADPNYFEIMDFQDILGQSKPYHFGRFLLSKPEEVRLFEQPLQDKVRDRFQLHMYYADFRDQPISEEEKTKLYMERYILAYRSIIRSSGGKDTRTAEAIYTWFKDDLKLELPKELHKGEKLSFPSLILDEKINQRGRITPLFCAMIGQNYHKLTAPFDDSKESQQFKLELELEQYIHHRPIEGESTFLKMYRSIFGREHFGMQSKIQVLTELLEAIQGKSVFQSTDIKLQVLIVEWAKC
jgi:hypothetical protein